MHQSTKTLHKVHIVFLNEPQIFFMFLCADVSCPVALYFLSLHHDDILNSIPELSSVNITLLDGFIQINCLYFDDTFTNSVATMNPLFSSMLLTYEL